MDLKYCNVLMMPVSHCYSQQQATHCESGICYAVNVPEASAAQGKGDIFFQISGPSSLQWVRKPRIEIV